MQKRNAGRNRRPKPVLTDSPVARATGPRILFLVGAVVTIALLQWIQHMRVTGDIHGLTPIFFTLFAYGTTARPSARC